MDRMRGYSNLGARREVPDGIARERWLRALAERLKPQGRAKLHLSTGCAEALRSALREAEVFSDDGDEALRRLKADEGRVETCLRQAQSESGARTVATEGEPRVLLLARALVGDGERLLTRDLLMREIAIFDAARGLRMGRTASAASATRRSSSVRCSWAWNWSAPSF